MATRMLHYAMGGVLLGIFLGGFSSFSLSWAVYFVAVLVVVCAKSLRWLPMLAFAIGVSIALARSSPLQSGYDYISTQYDQSAVIEAVIIDDPVYHESGQYQFNARTNSISGEPATSTIRIRAYVNDVQRGDIIQATGKLRDGFASWQSSMYFAKVQILDRDNGVLHSWRARFISNVYTAVPDPEASLGLGFLIGIRTLLPDDLDEQLSTTGLTHIVAVSGYNLTILAHASRRLLAKRSRFQAVAFTVGMLLAFVSISGLSPSVSRALIVSFISLGAWYYGRRASPWLLLLYSSALSALWNPAFVWAHLGWYLSFAAFFGVLVLAPLVSARLYKDREPPLLVQIVIETSMAQLATLPIILFVFGELSIISLVANALVLPFIPLAMFVTFLVGSAMTLIPVVAGLFAWISYITLQYITSVIRILSSLEWALVPVQFSLLQMIISYVMVLVFYLGLRRSKRAPSGIIESR